jgi:anti-sigma factor RsiW
LKSSDFDKRLSAYQDGALTDPKRERLERELEREPALRKQLERSRALGNLVREAWTEGPAAPPPDVLLAALRPRLAAIARERREQPAWRRALEDVRIRLAGWFGPVPLATSAAAAFVLALALLPRSNMSDSSFTAALPLTRAESPMRAPFEPAAKLRTRTPSTQFMVPSMPFAPANLSQDSAAGVYDLSPRERPAMIFQNEDGSTMLWLLDEDDLSGLFGRMDGWG